MNKKDMAQEYVPGIWSIQQDKVKWLELYVGHEKPFIEFETAPFVDDLYKSSRTDFRKKPLQSNSERIVGWLGGTHIATFNTEWYSSILQGHKEFGKYPIRVYNGAFRASIADKTTRKEAGAKLVTLLTTARKPSIFNKVKTLCRRIYNQQDLDHIHLLPAGISLRFIPWNADPEDDTLSPSRQSDTEEHLRDHLKTQETSKTVKVSTFRDLYTEVRLSKGITVCLLQILLTLRCRDCDEVPLFFQVNRKLNEMTKRHETHLVCHQDEYKEAVEVATNLCALAMAKFGEKAARFFKDSAVQEARQVRYDRQTLTLKPVNEKENTGRKRRKVFRESDASIRAAILRGQSLDDFEEYQPGGNELDSDDEDESVYSSGGDPIFDINRLFNLNPAIKQHPQYADGDELVVSFITNTTTFNRQHQDDDSSLSTRDSSGGLSALERDTQKMNIDGSMSDHDMLPSERKTGVRGDDE